jgi:predicted amidohydrolase
MHVGKRRYVAAAIQMESGADFAANVARAEELLDAAARRGAALAVLPETFAFMGRQAEFRRYAEPLDGPLVSRLRGIARRTGMVIVAGTVFEEAGKSAGDRADGRADDRVDGLADGRADDRVYNTCPVIAADGTLLAAYRKVHLYDNDVTGGPPARESAAFIPGDELVVARTDLGSLGLAICYDLRFCELTRRLAVDGAQVIALPAAFTLYNGRDHWETLLRARAIENLVYIVAADQAGRPPESYACNGRSMIVDPWGIVLATARDGEDIACAEIDLDRLAALRQRLPCLEHRRPEVYG